MPVLFVAPTVLVLLGLTIYPLLYSVWLAFHSLELAFSPFPEFAGFGNFVRAWEDSRFWGALKNTAVYVVAGVGLQLGLGLVFALLLNRQGRGRRLLTSLFFLPMVVAPVVAGFQWRMILHDGFGPLNYLLRSLGFEGASWLADPKLALGSVIAADVWEWTPFLIVVLLAGLQSIPTELYEAGRVDGAGGWQAFANITWPLLKPVIIIGLLVRSIDAFKLIDLVYVLTSGGPGNRTEILGFYTYLTGFRYFSVGYAAALAFIQVAILTVVARFFLRFLREQEAEA